MTWSVMQKVWVPVFEVQITVRTESLEKTSKSAELCCSTFSAIWFFFLNVYLRTLYPDMHPSANSVLGVSLSCCTRRRTLFLCVFFSMVTGDSQLESCTYIFQLWVWVDLSICCSHCLVTMCTWPMIFFGGGRMFCIPCQPHNEVGKLLQGTQWAFI